MKNFKSIIISLFILLTLFTCKQNDKEKTIITLEFNNTAVGQITITGHSFKYNKKLNKNNKEPYSQIDTLTLPSSGYYNLYFNRNLIPLYLRKGTKTVISIDPQNFNEVSFSKDSEEENNYLLKKFKLKKATHKKDIYRLSEKQFLSELNDYKENIIKLLDIEKVSADFRVQEIKEINYEIASKQILYPKTHSNLTREIPNLSRDYYDNLKSINFKDTSAYSNSQTNKYPFLVKNYYNRIAKEKRKENGNNEILAFLKEVDKDFPTGKVKDDLFKFKLNDGLKKWLNLDNIFNTYVSAVTDKKSIENVKKQYLSLKKLDKGAYAPNFELEDLDKKMMSLNSLRGNNLYIDVWATWCAPCIDEFPALKNLIEKYKDIKFISISIDKKKNYDKWRHFIKGYNLTNTQLIAYNNSDFQENYVIGSIPRFIIIDKKGKIVSIDAPRPSNPELENIFSNLN